MSMRPLFLAVLMAAALHGEARGADDEYDLQLGEEIFDTCAPCHGPFGQGGGGGVYPRLAGMDIDYLIRQLDRFKTRVRENIPMIPYANDRDLPEEDMEAVAAYMETLRLKTRLPELKDDIDGLTRLKQAKQVLNIPRHPGGDEAHGGKVYGELCARCHGNQGEGTVRAPLLAGQHIPYLIKQFENYRTKQRDHREADKLLIPLTQADIDGILTFLSLQDDTFTGEEVKKKE
ncbi:MAG: c-type cytochrome [Rhodospirillales bacterium]|nr:c-type cytochrome [Rhodospirillales bacterium]